MAAFDLKSEEDVKLYLHNLWVEYQFGCYKEKNPNVCHLLGDYFEAVKKDFNAAANVYKQNCDDFKYNMSCHKFAKYCVTGKGLPSEDYLSAFKYFKKSCEQNNSDGCLMAGLLQSGTYKGIEHDFDKGFGLIKGACENRHSVACYYLAGMYLRGVDDNNHQLPPKDNKVASRSGQITTTATVAAESPPVKIKLAKNMVKAFEYSLMACELENMYACANVSRMYTLGEGVEANKELAEKYKKVATKLQERVTAIPEIKFQQGS